MESHDEEVQVPCTRHPQGLPPRACSCRAAQGHCLLPEAARWGPRRPGGCCAPAAGCHTAGFLVAGFGFVRDGGEPIDGQLPGEDSFLSSSFTSPSLAPTRPCYLARGLRCLPDHPADKALPPRVALLSPGVSSGSGQESRDASPGAETLVYEHMQSTKSP